MKSLAQPDVAADLRIRLLHVTADSAARWGRMTAHQMLCHVADAFRMALSEKQSAPVGTLLHRTLGKWFALHVPVPFPRGYPTLREIEQGVGGTPPTTFEKDHREALTALDRFLADDAMGNRKHPIFGPLTRAEWCRWGYIHTDHHLRQFGH